MCILKKDELLTNINPGWEPFIGPRKEALEKLVDGLGETAPERGLIFRFAGTAPENIKVVILGQDPYPQPGAATGRAFEVAGLDSWTRPFRQSSLKNILRAIYKAETGVTSTFTQVREEIKEGRFKILPPDRLFGALEAQGVLLLNTYLTCRPGSPGSHRSAWKDFARELIEWLDGNVNAAWFLWGADARSYASCIHCGKVYESRHPMMSTRAYDDFMNNLCFRETSEIIDWTGIGKRKYSKDL